MLDSEENDEKTARSKVRATTYNPDNADPYNMTSGFVWSEVDVTNPAQQTEVYDLLYQNYVEDDDYMFRFDYSRDFLTWALTRPGFEKAFHLGVRSSRSGRLMAFISGGPARTRVHD